MPQQQRGQRGCERERVERGDSHRKRNRQRELLIEAAGGPGEERDGDEHRDQYQRGRDDRAEHLAHRVGRRLLRLFLVLLHVPLDVLDHDDRIVHDNACGKDDREERERVDREAEEVHERERADEGYWHRERRDDRGAPALEKQEHHEHDEAHRLGERLEHLPNRLLNDRGCVERNRVLQARRERLRQARQLRKREGVHVERVGGRQRDHGEADRVTPLETEHRRVRLGAKLHPADILQANERAFLSGLHDDVVELGPLVEAARGAHAELIGLALGRGRIANAARSHVDVLLAQRIHDIARGQLPRGQAGRIKPDPHRVLALAEHEHVGHARHALERVLDVDVDVVRNEERIVLPLLGIGARSKDEVRRRLLHGDTKLTDFRRQAAQRLVDTVLHVDRGNVGIARDVERHGN